MENRPRKYYNQWLAPPSEVMAIALFSRELVVPNIIDIPALPVGTLRALKVMPYFL